MGGVNFCLGLSREDNVYVPSSALDVCFCFRRVGMRELIYPGDRLLEVKEHLLA